MGLKASGKLKAGKHFVYVTGKPRSNINWDLAAIENGCSKKLKKVLMLTMKPQRKLKLIQKWGFKFQ